MVAEGRGASPATGAEGGMSNFDERTYGRNPFADLLLSARGGWQ